MEPVTYPNRERVGRCEFAVKAILGLALVVLCPRCLLAGESETK